MPIIFILFSLLFQVHKGVVGVVEDESGKPIKGAKIYVKNKRKFVKTANDGDYWRLLLPGDYEITATANGYSRLTKKAKVEDAPATKINFVLSRGMHVNDFHSRSKGYDQMTHAREKPGTGVIPGPLFKGGLPGNNAGGTGGGLNSYGVGNHDSFGSDVGGGDVGGLGAGDGAEPTSQQFQDGPAGIQNDIQDPVGHLENGLESSPDVGVLPDSRVEDGGTGQTQNQDFPKMNSFPGIDDMRESNGMSPTGYERMAIGGSPLDTMAMQSPFESNSRDFLGGQYSANDPIVGMQRSRTNGWSG